MRERHRVVADRVDVALLARGLGPHGLAAAQDLGRQHVGRALVGLEHLDGAADAVAVEAVALLEQHHHLLEQAADPLGVGGVAGDGDLVAPDVDRDRERVLDEAQELVALTEQADHEVVARNEDLDLSRGDGEDTSASMVAPAGRARPACESAYALALMARRPSCSSRQLRSSGRRPSTAATHAQVVATDREDAGR